MIKVYRIFIRFRGQLSTSYLTSVLSARKLNCGMLSTSATNKMTKLLHISLPSQLSGFLHQPNDALVRPNGSISMFLLHPCQLTIGCMAPSSILTGSEETQVTTSAVILRAAVGHLGEWCCYGNYAKQLILWFVDDNLSVAA